MSRKFIFVLVLAIILSACGIAPTQTSEALPTVTPFPSTATSTSTPEPPTSTPTATPIPLPTDVLTVLQEYPGYTLVDDDNNGTNDRIVIANGDTLFKFVPTEERYEQSVEWQRVKTFPIDGGDKMEMSHLDTPDEAYEYMLKNNILWKATWGTRDLENTQEKSDYWMKKFRSLYLTMGVGSEVTHGFFIPRDKDSLRSHIMVYNASDGTVIVFLNSEDKLQAIYVDENATTVSSWLYALIGVPPPPRP